MAESLNLGTLAIQIEANTSSLNRVIPSIDKLEKVVNKLAISIDKMTKALEKGSNKSSKTVITNNKKVSNSLKRTSRSYKTNTEHAHKMQSKMQGVSTSATLMLGPLNGVASRVTALTGLFNRNNLALAAMFTTMVAFSAGTLRAIKAGAAHQKILAQWEGQLYATGGAVGFTTSQLDDMSKAVAINTLASVEGAREATTALLSFTSITGKTFERTLKLAADMSTVLGGSLVGETKKLAKSLANPGEALDTLSKAGIRFTETQIRMLKLMDVTGRTAEAQGMILDKLEKRFKGAGEAAAANTLAGAWDTLGERATLFFEKLLNGQGALSGITKLVNKMAETLEKLTKSVEDGSYSTSIYAKAINGLAHGLAFLLENIIPVSAALVALSVTAPLAGLLLALPISFAGVLKLQKALWVLKRTAFAAGAAFAGWQIGTYLRENFKEVRKFAFSTIGAFHGIAIGIKAIGKIAWAGFTAPLDKVLDGIRESFAGLIEGLLSKMPDNWLAEKMGIDSSLKKEMQLFADSLRATKTNTEALIVQVDKITDEYKKEKDAIDDLVVGYFLYEDSLGKTAKATDANIKKSQALAAKYKDVIKGIDALNKIADKYGASSKAAREFSDTLLIIDFWTRKNTISQKDYMAALGASEADYAAFVKRTANLTKQAIFESPFGAILKTAEADLKALESVTFTGGLLDFFNIKGTDGTLAFEKQVASLTKTLSDLPDAGLKAVIKQTETLAKERGLEDLIPAGTIKSAEDLARAQLKIKDAARSTKDAWKEAGSFILGQYTDVINQMQALYEQQAAAYGQIATDALESGRSTANFYMDLADTVRYSNNAQAQSFEDKAMAAAKSAAAEYAANKKLQDQANASAKRNFENQKMLNKAQILMSTGVAMVKALELGPVAGPIAMGAMAALGATQLSMVSKQSYTPRQFGGAVVPGQSYKVGEVGEELFVPNTPGTIVTNDELNNMGSGGRGDVNITFQVIANDTTGFDQLLQSRRGQIVNMIRQATNEQMGASF